MHHNTLPSLDSIQDLCTFTQLGQTSSEVGIYRGETSCGWVPLTSLDVNVSHPQANSDCEFYCHKKNNNNSKNKIVHISSSRDIIDYDLKNKVIFIWNNS